MLAAAAILIGGCATAGPGGSPDRAPSWPYAGIAVRDQLPPELEGQAIFTGRWLAATPDGDAVFTETVVPRYLARVPFAETWRRRYLDLGAGAAVENLGFLEQGRTLLLVAAVGSPHSGRAVVARAVLTVDLDGGILLDSVPLARDGYAVGLALDPFKRRIFLYQDEGGGEGTMEIVDLYSGRVRRRAPVGSVPAGVTRKGLVVDDNVRTLFCLTGGELPRSDFQPVAPDTGYAGPQVTVLDTDSLTVKARVPLDEGYEPRVIAWSEERDRAYVLETNRRRSVVVVVDGAFYEVRNRIELPEPVTDLVLRGGYAFAPGPNGVYIVDLVAESWISRSALIFDVTGEMAVSGDLSTAFVLYQSVSVAGVPGIAVVGLQSGTLREILQ